MTYVVKNVLPHQKCLIKNPEKKTMTAALVMVCDPVAGLRVPSCHRCPWQPQCLNPLGHRSSERALVSAPFQSVPLLPRSKKQNAPRRFRYWSEKLKISLRASSTRLCPTRRRSISLLHCRRIQPPEGAVPSMQA